MCIVKSRNKLLPDHHAAVNNNHSVRQSALDPTLTVTRSTDFRVGKVRSVGLAPDPCSLLDSACRCLGDLGGFLWRYYLRWAVALASTQYV
jgi:hypothetical protein